LILAEDTRRTNQLLSKYEITDKKIDSFNDHNKERKTPKILEYLKQDKKIAIVSDSGTPGISDPGFYLVRETVKNGIKIVPVPGACAFLSALVASGLATDCFTFYGFLPKKEAKKNMILKSIKSRKETAILYESPYRLVKNLKIIAELMPDRSVVVARELTKKFEEFIRGNASEVYERLKDIPVKGEIVLLIGKS
jgi:16S rRNA (cytidine1402-2'-O)-methyltransferase